MSIVKTNKFQNLNGVTYNTVLQAVSSSKTSTFSTTTFINAGGSATGLSVSITPMFATSKILIFGHITSGSTSGVTQCYYKLKRNGTEVGSGTAVSNRPGVIARGYLPDNGACHGEAFSFLDSPSSTSTLTYEIYLGTEGNGTSYMNRTAYDGDSMGGARSASSITVMEIAQ